MHATVTSGNKYGLACFLWQKENKELVSSTCNAQEAMFMKHFNVDYRRENLQRKYLFT